MIPLSISASALENAEQCLAKFHSHNILKGDGFQNKAATLGTTLHATLEMFVKPNPAWHLMILKAAFRACFMQHFIGVIDIDEDQWYQDGIAILTNWFNRRGQYDDIISGTIVDKELKQSFPVPYVVNGEKFTVPMNYIIDRLDLLPDGSYRVVDYKSQRQPLRAEDMRKKLQVRIYSLATRIRFPEATSIQVQYDFLRYQSVTVTLTKADDVATWDYVKSMLQRIVDTPEIDVPESLGDGCHYCVRRVSCKKIRANIMAGGIFGLDLDALLELRVALGGQNDGISNVISDIDTQLLAYAHEDDTDVIFGETYRVDVSRGSKRYVDQVKINEIVPLSIRAEYGHINVGDIDKLKQDERLTDGQRSLLSTAIFSKTGDPKVKVKPIKEGLD